MKPFTGSKHDTSYGIISNMLCHFHDTCFSIIINFECIFDAWKVMVGKLYVYNRSHDLNDFSFIHIASPLLLFLTIILELCSLA